MSILKITIAATLAVFLSACGGGGGDSGSNSSGTSSSTTSSTTTTGTGSTTTTTTTTTAPVLTLTMQSAATGLPVQAIAASNSNVTRLVASLKSSTGAALAGETITFAEGLTNLAFFSGGNSAVTDSSGLATVTVQRVNLQTFGTGSFTASFAGSPTVPLSATSGALSFRADAPTLQVDLRDAADAVTTSIGSNLTTSVRALLQFEDGTKIANKAVAVTDADGKVSFPNSNSALTDSNGVAKIVVTRASLTVNGAGTLTASSTIPPSSGSSSGTVVIGRSDYQLGTANIALTGLNVGTGVLSAYGNRSVSVSVTSNGVAASIPVQVTFSATCGVVSPAVVSTNASGVASTTYTATDPACSGTNVSITAAASGAVTQSALISVSAPVATNVQFVSASPQLIYLAGTVGTTQAQVVFKVVDSSGNPVQNRTLQLSLSNTATGVSIGTLGNTSSISLVSDSSGNVSAPVFSGTVPTSMTVRATLLDTAGAATSVFSDSNVLNVASGRPAQRGLSLAVEKASIEGANIDNKSTNLTLTMSDRQGNPVPPGTQVNFVAESGVLIPAVCFVPPPVPATASSPAIPSSSCSVALYSSGTRTANGKVAVMAYVAGEEDFTDASGNNVYDSGEAFTDLGRAFMDTVGTGAGLGVYNSGEFQVPRVGAPACSNGGSCSGDGAWGAADVRKQVTVVFATSAATITTSPAPLTAGSTLVGSTDLVLNGLTVAVQDGNGNSMPAGTEIVVTVVENQLGAQGYVGAFCTLSTGGTTIVPNTLSPISIPVTLSFCTAGDGVAVKVTTPGGFVTNRTFTIQ